MLDMSESSPPWAQEMIHQFELGTAALRILEKTCKMPSYIVYKTIKYKFEAWQETKQNKDKGRSKHILNLIKVDKKYLSHVVVDFSSI